MKYFQKNFFKLKYFMKYFKGKTCFYISNHEAWGDNVNTNFGRCPATKFTGGGKKYTKFDAISGNFRL